MSETKNKKRILYLDLIRVISIYLVIFTHTANMGSKLYEFGEYGILRSYLYIGIDVLRRINVPLFLMVSGALMLKKSEKYKEFLSKRVLKYILITVIASLFYYIFYYQKEFNIYSFLLEVYQGNVIGLFWFLYAYIGYLLILPFLRKMIHSMDMDDYKYLLVLGIVFKSALPLINDLLQWGSIGITCYFVLDIIFYPCLGYFFAHIVSYEKFHKKNIAIGGIITMLCIIIITSFTYLEGKSGTYTENYYSMLNIIPTCYFFCIMRKAGEKIEKNQFISSAIYWLGDCSFGIYLLSLYIQMDLAWIYRNLYSMFPKFPLSCSLVYVGCVMFVGALWVTVLKIVPGIKRLL